MPDDPPDPTPYALAAAAQQRLQRRRRKPPATVRQRAAPREDAPGGSATQRAGADYEDQALALLVRHGLQPLARNLRASPGEIDLALRDGDTLVLVEVRARRDRRFGGAAASIDHAKQRRLARAAAMLLPRLARRHWGGRTPPVRFDAVLFDGGAPLWVRAAFCLEPGA